LDFQQTGLLGLALAPTVGGVTAHYLSWRAIHYLLAAFGFAAFFCMFFLFPETSHPGTRGIDEYERAGKVHSKWKPVMLNPLSQLLMLRSPNILAVVRLPNVPLYAETSWNMTFPARHLLGTLPC
jgi:MFS family permease